MPPPDSAHSPLNLLSQLLWIYWIIQPEKSFQLLPEAKVANKRSNNHVIYKDIFLPKRALQSRYSTAYQLLLSHFGSLTEGRAIWEGHINVLLIYGEDIVLFLLRFSINCCGHCWPAACRSVVWCQSQLWGGPKSDWKHLNVVTEWRFISGGRNRSCWIFVLCDDFPDKGSGSVGWWHCLMSDGWMNDWARAGDVARKQSTGSTSDCLGQIRRQAGRQGGSTSSWSVLGIIPACE